MQEDSREEKQNMRFKSVAVDYLDINFARNSNNSKGEKAESAPNESFLRADSLKSSSNRQESRPSEDVSIEFEEFNSYHQNIARKEIEANLAKKAERHKREKEYRNRQR